MPRKAHGDTRGNPRTGKVKPAKEQAAFQGTIRKTARSFPKSLDALRRLTRKDLLALARRQGLKGRSRLKKEELVRALGTFLKIPPAEAVPPPLPDLLDWENAPLPEAYGKDRLVLMPIDPYWVHAYWEMAAQRAPEPRGCPGEESRQARCVLRVYDVTFIHFDGTNAHSSFDIEITPEARNWYINLWSPEKSLCAELGLVQADGTFSPLARSNVIQAPPAWPSPNTEEHWLLVGLEQEGTTPAQALVSSEVVARTRHPGPPPPPPGPSDATVGRVSPVVTHGQHPPLPPPSRRLEGLPRPEDSIRAEEYRRYLEETRRRMILPRDEPVPPAPTPLPVEDACSVFDLGLSSIELGKKP